MRLTAGGTRTSGGVGSLSELEQGRFRGAQRLLKEKRPGIICEMHSEPNNRLVLEGFSQLGSTCKSCGAPHNLALSK